MKTAIIGWKTALADLSRVRSFINCGDWQLAFPAAPF
jgi:hypothetical protein